MTPTGAQEGTEQESVQADTESVDESLESGNKDTSVATSPSTSVSLETQTAAPGPNTSILQWVIYTMPCVCVEDESWSIAL